MHVSLYIYICRADRALSLLQFLLLIFSLIFQLSLLSRLLLLGTFFKPHHLWTRWSGDLCSISIYFYLFFYTLLFHLTTLLLPSNLAQKMQRRKEGMREKVLVQSTDANGETAYERFLSLPSTWATCDVAGR